jgi:hypothetical protein
MTGVANTRFSMMTVLLVLLAVIPAGALAEARREGGGDDATRRAQLLMRQMQAEIQKVNAENAKLKDELDAQKKDQDMLEENLASTEKSLSRSRQSNASLTDRVRRDSEKYHTLTDRYRETLAKLRTAQFKVAYLQEAVIERNKWIDVCRGNNDELYRVNNELLDRYLNRGLFSALGESEIVTGLGRVRLENMVEEYRYKLDDLQVLEYKESRIEATMSESASSVRPLAAQPKSEAGE